MNSEATATWAGVFATLVISLCSLVLAWRAQRATRRADAALHERGLEREASRVSAWIATVWANDDPDDDAQKQNILVIRNASDAPIHQVEARALMNKREHTFSAKVCPPGESYSRWNPRARYVWTFLASSDELTRADCGTRPFSKSDNWALLSLRFTDALGVQWAYIPGTGVQRVQ